MEPSFDEKRQPVKYQLVELLVNKYDFDPEKDTCLICMGLLRHPVKCAHCASRFCRECASNWNIRKQRCPKRCSEGNWSLKPVLNPKVFRFKCPYSDKCPVMATCQAIEAHLKPNGCDILRRNQVKTQTCSYGHVLNVYPGPAGKPESKNKPCGKCRRKGIHMRSECITCQKYYCVSCKPLPLTKLVCLCKEKHEVTKGFGEAFMCDRCGRRTLPLQSGNFDLECKLSVCKRCYEKLPEGEKRVDSLMEQEEEE